MMNRSSAAAVSDSERKQRVEQLSAVFVEFDLDGSGRCERDHFGEACVMALGYDGDIEKMWAMLKRDNTQSFLTLDAFDYTADRCFYMGDYDMRSYPKMKRPKDPKFRPRGDDDGRV